MAARTGGPRTAGRRCKGRGAPRRRLPTGRVAARRPAGATGRPRPHSHSCLLPPLRSRLGPRGLARRGAPPSDADGGRALSMGPAVGWLRREAAEPPSPMPQPGTAPSFNSTGLVSPGHFFAPQTMLLFRSELIQQRLREHLDVIFRNSTLKCFPPCITSVIPPPPILVLAQFGCLAFVRNKEMRSGNL